MGHRVTGGLCDELCRDPVDQDLIPRPDGQGSWCKSYSEPNALLVHCHPMMGPILPEPQGVEVGLTYWSTGKKLCQPKPSLRI